MHSRLNNRPPINLLRLIDLLVIPALLCVGTAYAQKLPIPQNLPNNLQIHGFFSQSWLKSSDNNVFGKSSSDSGSFDFREIGLNASMRPLKNLQFSVQGLSRWAGKGSPGNIRLDYGFIDYTFLSAETGQMGIRLGRMKNPLGFYNDTRDVSFTRPSILLPAIHLLRSGTQGCDLPRMAYIYTVSTVPIWVSYPFRVDAVRPLVRGAEAEVALLGNDLAGHLTPEISYIGRVNYELDEGKLRFAVSGTQLNIGYAPGAVD